MTDAIALSGDERELALAETQAVLAHASGPYRGELTDVVAAIDDGALPAAEAETFERLLELSLQAGRVRALHGPGGEQAALRLYRRLPRGAAVAQSAREVGDALNVLNGRTLDSVSLQSLGPGSYSLTIVADGAEVTVRLDRQGARVASVTA